MPSRVGRVKGVALQTQQKLVAAIIFAVILLSWSAQPAMAAADAGQVMTFNGDCVVVADQHGRVAELRRPQPL